MIFVDSNLIGNFKKFLAWAENNYNYEDFRNEFLYETLCKEEYNNYFLNSKVINVIKNIHSI